MNNERIKFYSKNDLSCGYYLDKIENIIKKYDNISELKDINDAIELYNIKKYFDNEIYLKRWKEKDIEVYKKIIKSSYGLIYKFCSNINEDNFLSIYKSLYRDYKSDFWEIFKQANLYKKISEEKINYFLEKKYVSIHELLRHKTLVSYYGKVIRDFLIKDYSAAELLLDQYEIDHDNKRDTFYFPNELDNEDKKRIISNYIDYEYANLNYLRIIVNMNNNEIKLAPKIFLKAKKKIEEKEKELFGDNNGFCMETAVGFSNSQTEEIIVNNDRLNLEIIYSKKWIEENKDYPTILNNFIYLFDFADLQMRWNLVSKVSQLGVLERHLGLKSKKAYIKGMAFDRLDVLSLLQMKGYYECLKEFNIRLEEVIEWFFEEYLLSEFGAKDFKINMPSESSTFLEKCSSIMPAMESVLKQFTLFVEEKEIDFELLDIRSQSISYSKIPSLINKKYVYGIGEEYDYISFLLFSNQSSLSYVNSLQKSFDSFFEVLCKEKVKINDFSEYCKPDIKKLIDNGYLILDENEFITLKNNILINILKDLYFNEVISYWKYPEIARQIIDELEKNKLVEFKNTLFSRLESDYIDYFLNKAQFNNGWDLRNKYAHIQPNVDNDEIHYNNYMIFLRMFILVVIKINDEFCIFENINKEIFDK